mgnify:FL=1
MEERFNRHLRRKVGAQVLRVGAGEHGSDAATAVGANWLGVGGARPVTITAQCPDTFAVSLTTRCLVWYQTSRDNDNT